MGQFLTSRGLPTFGVPCIRTVTPPEEWLYSCHIRAYQDCSPNQGAKDSIMTTQVTETHKQTLQELWEQGTRGDLDAIDTLYADDVVYQDPSAEIRGRESLREYLGTWLHAFPDMQFEFHEMIAEGNTVVTYYTVRGTHENEFQGIPATGNSFEGIGMTIDRFEGEEVVEEINVWDNLSFFEQLGIDPAEI